MPSNGPRRVVTRVATAVATAVAIVVVLPGTVPAAAHGQDAPRGAALLGQARASIGGEQRLAGVRTLQVTGTFRRVVGGNDTEGDFAGAASAHGRRSVECRGRRLVPQRVQRHIRANGRR